MRKSDLKNKGAVQAAVRQVADEYLSEGAGEFAIARYKRDGSLDTTFGREGATMTALSAGNDTVYELALRRDGKLLAAGTADAVGTSSFALVRYLGSFECLVPSIKSRRLARARKAIVHAHCSVGTIVPLFSIAVPKGRVISQRPAAGARRTEGAKVRLAVSRGQRNKP